MDTNRRLFYSSVFLLTLTGTAVVWGEAIGLTLFVQHLGIKNLPLAYIAEAILSIFFIFSFEQLKGYIHEAFIVAMICLLGVVILLFGYEFAQHHSNLGFGLYYAAQRIIRDLLVFYLWTYVVSFFENQTRYLVTRILLYSRIGIVIGSFILVVLTFSLSSWDFVWMWVGILFLSALGIGIFADEFHSLPHAQSHTLHRRQTIALDRLGSALKSYWGSHLMRWLSLGAFTMMVALRFVAFRSTGVFWETFDHNELALLRWLGILSGVTALLVFPIQYIVLPFALKRAYVSKFVDVYPVSMGVTMLGVLIFPVWSMATLAEFVRSSLRSSLHEPVLNQLKNTLPSSVRVWVHTFLEGIIEPSGRLLGGLVLLLFLDDVFSTGILVGLGAIFAGVFIYAEYRAGQLYNQTLDASLAAGQYGFLRKSLQERLTTNQELINQLLARLRELSPDDREILLIAEALSETHSQEGFEALLEFWSRCPSSLQAELLMLLAEGWPQQRTGQAIRAVVTEALESDETKLRRAALKAMTIYPNLLDTFRVAQYLIDYDPSVSTLAAQLLLQHSSERLSRAAHAQLNWLAKSSSAATRAMAVSAFIMGGVNRYGERVVSVDVEQFLADPSARVRLNVLPAASLEELVTAAYDLSSSVRRAAIKRLKRHRYRSSLLIQRKLFAITGTNTNDFQIRAVINYWHLMTALASVSPRYCKGILRAEVRRGLKQVDYLTSMSLILHDLKYPPLTALVAQLHNDRAQLIHAILSFVGAVYGSNYVNAITRTLQIERSEVACRLALETLGTLTTSDIAKQINYLLTNRRYNVPLVSEDRTWHVEDAKAVISVVLSQKHEWFPMLALYVLTALPRPIFESLVDSKQVEAILAKGKTSLDDAVREGTRLLRQALQSDIHALRTESHLSRIVHDERDDGIDMLSTIERMVFLRNVTFFENLRLDQLRTLARVCEEMSVNEGEAIIRQGEAGDSLFVIVEGDINITHNEAPDKVIVVRKPGDVLGEISLFDGGLRSANAIAATPALVLVVYRDELDNALADDPGIALDMLRAMAQLVRENNRSIAELSMQIDVRELTENLDVEPELS